MRTPQGFIQGYNAQVAVTEDHVVVAGCVTNDHNDVDQFVPMVTKAQDNLADTGGDRIGTVVADAGYLSLDNLLAELGCEALIAPGKARDLLQTTTRHGAVEVDAIARHDLESVRQAIAEDDARRIALLGGATKRGELRKAAEALGISLPHASNLRKALHERGPEAIRRKSLPPGHRRPSTKAVASARFTTPQARATYAKRAILAEPTFGQIKGARGIRGFLRRGMTGCTTEWMLILTTHNIRRLLSARRTGGFFDRITQALSCLIPQAVAV